jgi:hypothetical protein
VTERDENVEPDLGGLPGEPPPREGDDPRERPPDPAGTRPKYDPESLLPANPEPLLSSAIDSTAEDEDEDAERRSLLPERIATAGAMASASRDDGQPPHAPRFQFLLGALVALGMAAVAIVVAVAVSGPSPKGPQGPRWSIWQPNGNTPVADQIAQHVGREYRLASGHQLVFVTGGAPEVAQLPVTFVLQQAVSQGGDYVPIDGKGALYRFCGFGPKCSITDGKPSTRRGLLLRREALELALYTFRYTDVDNVVVLFPPALAKKPSKTPDPSLAVYLRRQDVDPQLAQPLNATLATKAPKPETVTRSPDAGFVDRVTKVRQFKYTLSQANQDARAYLILRQLG